MEHVAIDLGGRESQVCIRNAETEFVLQRRVRTRELAAFLATRPVSRVVQGSSSDSVADTMLPLSLARRFCLSPDTELQQRRGVGAGGAFTSYMLVKPGTGAAAGTATRTVTPDAADPRGGPNLPIAEEKDARSLVSSVGDHAAKAKALVPVGVTVPVPVPAPDGICSFMARILRLLQRPAIAPA